MSPLLRRILEPVVDTISTALIILIIVGMVALLSLLGCAGPTREIVTAPPQAWDRPACIVVFQPPPSAPPIFREWTSRCRDYDGRQLPADALCLTTAEAQELVTFAAQQTSWALTAWHACSESVESDVRVLD